MTSRLQLLLLLLLSGIGLFILYLVLSNPTMLELSSNISGKYEHINSFYTSIFNLFHYSDDWNYITLSFLVSFFILLFCLNYFLFGLLLKKYNKKGSKLKGETFWFVKNVCSIASVFLLIIIIALVISFAQSSPYIINDTKLISDDKSTIMVLGTRKVLPSGKINSFYKDRMDLAIDLYKKNLVSGFYLSGDGGSKIYDETIDMASDLISSGVPKSMIKRDIDGKRTYLSMVNYARDYGNKKVYVISQKFHLERAIPIARNMGIPAIGVYKKESMTFGMIKRELLARPRFILDLLVFNPELSLTDFKRRHFDFSQPSDLTLLLAVLLCTGFAAFSVRKVLEH